MKRYENKLFYYTWKSRGIPTTYGLNPCFLDTIKSSEDIRTQLIYTQLSFDHPGNSEFGLINRLDNDTGGLLFFAKNISILQDYKILQSENKVEKIYICDVYGIVKFDNIEVSNPIYHHKYNDSKMTLDPNKGRGKPIITTTSATKLYIDEHNKISTLLIKLHKGARHQIRVHLSSIGHPIVGENIYARHKQNNQNILHLRSIGLNIYG